jgi:hypothetical protein
MMATEKKQTRISQKQLDIVRQKAKKDPRSGEPREIDYDNYVSSLSKMLTFYGTEFDNKSKKEWAVEYFKEVDREISKKISKVSHQYFCTIGSLIRMKENGVLLNESIEDRILAIGREIATKVPEATDSVQQPIQKGEKTDYFLGEFEGYLDDQLGKKKTLGISSWVKQYSPNIAQVNSLKSLITKKINEYNSILDDKEMLSAYAITKKACSDIIKSLVESVSELVVMYQRKPRAPKVVSLQKMVQSVKYLKTDQSLGLTSFDPVGILGKTGVITFNTKTRKIQYYVAQDGKEFSIKGTSILNFDEEKSIQKTLRNPKDQLLSLLQLPKKAFEKALSMIKSVDTVPTGRLNDDTLLCRTI